MAWHQISASILSDNPYSSFLIQCFWKGPYKRAHIAVLLLYCAKGTAVEECSNRKGMAFFQQIFSTKWHTQVKNWTSKLDIFSNDLILFPINLSLVVYPGALLLRGRGTQAGVEVRRRSSCQSSQKSAAIWALLYHPLLVLVFSQVANRGSSCLKYQHSKSCLVDKTQARTPISWFLVYNGVNKGAPRVSKILFWGSFSSFVWDGIKALLLRQNSDWCCNWCGELRLPQRSSIAAIAPPQ